MLLSIPLVDLILIKNAIIDLFHMLILQLMPADYTPVCKL